jgi:toxin ParE1/3/4
VSRFRLTPRALKDLDSIADHTMAAWGERQTKKYISELEQKFQWLADQPYGGRVRDEIGLGYRSFLSSSHVIFYLIDEAGISIVGVPHGSMDIEAYF